MMSGYFLKIVYITLLVIVLQYGCAFSNVLSRKSNRSKSPNNKAIHSRSGFPSANTLTRAQSYELFCSNDVRNEENIGKMKSKFFDFSVIASSPAVSAVTDIVAKVSGYAIGLGALTVYLPIISSILSNKSSEGSSIATWIANMLGLTAAALYPLKKGFPIPSFIELISLSIQSAFILGLVCFYQGKIIPYALSMAVFIFGLSIFFKTEVPPNYLSGLQIFAMLICNYANIPQILLNYQNKHASWSIITALLSVGGNLVRVLTTLYFTKDKLVLSGYMLGVFTNSILLGQILYYNGMPKIPF